MSQKELDKKLKQIINDLKPYQPEKVILYGSYAKGNPREESDIDLLIVKKTNKPRWERIREVVKLLYKKGYSINDSKFPGILDFKKYTPQELQREINLGDFFIEEVIEQGKTIYEK